MESEIPRLLLLITLLLLSAFFSSAETAFTTVNQVKIKTMANNKNKKAQQVQKILYQKSRMISTILICNNIVNISASAITTTMAIRIFGNAMVGVITGILTFILIIFGEIIPKKAASRNALKITLAYAPIVRIIMLLFTPVVVIIDKCTSFIKGNDYNSVTEEDICSIVDVGKEDGALDAAEHRVIKNTLNFNDKTAKDIMIRRISVSSVIENMSLQNILRTFRKEKYTRLIVLRNNNPIGFINIKDIIFMDSTKFSFQKYMRKPYIISENKRLFEILPFMKKNLNNMAFVYNNQKEFVGILTIEDLLEELVGEIDDEFDEEVKGEKENVYCSEKMA